MKLIWPFFLLVLVMYACGSGTDEKIILRDEISRMEDSIMNSSRSISAGSRTETKLQSSLIGLLLDYYKKFPNDIYAPECLDKVHMVYSSTGNYKMAAQYADTLLLKYKDYVNRAMILESQAATYDFMLSPRDTAKVRYYNELLLSENPNLSKDKKAEIRYRLDHLDMTINDIISSSSE